MFVSLKYFELFGYLSAIIFHQMLQNQILRGKKIAIISDYLGCKWAGIILKQRGCQLISSEIDADLIVVDQTSVSNFPSVDTIIITGTSIPDEHLLALSGVLSTFGQQQSEFVPQHLVQILVANSLAIKILSVFANKKTNSQHTADKISILELIKYFGAFNISAKHLKLIQNPKGHNMLDGGSPYYSIYQCKQDQIAIGNLQPKFYHEMVKGLNLSNQEFTLLQNSQFDPQQWPQIRQILSREMLKKTAKEWQKLFQAYDTCITEVKLPFDDSRMHPKLLPMNPKL